MKFPEIVILSSIMLGCVGYGIMSREAPNRIPSKIWNRKVQVIDIDTLELIEVKVGPYERRYETDPDTSYKIMPDGRVVTMPATCNKCGEKVPRFPQKSDMTQKDIREMDLRHRNYQCVRCDGFVYHDMDPDAQEEADSEDVRISSVLE